MSAAARICLYDQIPALLLIYYDFILFLAFINPHLACFGLSFTLG